MFKEYKFFIGALTFFILLANSSHIFANTTTSLLTGEVISGELSMSIPNNLDLRASTTLTGKKQFLDINSIQSKVTDYRGIEEGWRLTLKSSNFDSYAKSFQLIVNGESISKSEKLVYTNNGQALFKVIKLRVKLEILAKAKAGTYSANLEWNLQPNIKNSLKE